MNFQPKELLLSVKRGKYRMDDPDSDYKDKIFKSVRPTVLDRDGKTCQFCGFYSEKFQEVHHLDDNHGNNSPDNLVTACALCHSAAHIGHSALKKRGIAIYIDPNLGLTQGGLNQIVRALWLAEESGAADAAQFASKTLESLRKNGAHDASKIAGISSLSDLSEYLLSLKSSDYFSRSEKLKGVYFLPSKAAYSEQIAYWRESSFKGTDSKKWLFAAKHRIADWHGLSHTDEAGIYKMLLN